MRKLEEDRIRRANAPADGDAAAEVATVFIVDDDPEVRKSISLLVESVNLQPAAYGTAREFLDAYDSNLLGCLILDVRMPEMTGLELQLCCAKRNIRLPVIILTAHGEVSMVSDAMRAGALDFLQKPYSPQRLLERINEAIALHAQMRVGDTQKSRMTERFGRLSSREREIFKLLIEGKNSKQIGRDLEISPKTVDNHRASILEKMEVEGVVELVRLTFDSDIG